MSSPSRCSIICSGVESGGSSSRRMASSTRSRRSPMRRPGCRPKRSMISRPSPLGSSGSWLSFSAISSERRERSSTRASARLRRWGLAEVTSARDRSSRSGRCSPISRLKRRTADSVQLPSYRLARRWCFTRKRTWVRSVLGKRKRPATASTSSAPMSSWRKKCTLPPGANSLVHTLPTSCSSAAHRTGRRGGVWAVTSRVWCHTSLWWYSEVWSKPTVAATSGRMKPSTRVSCRNANAACTWSPSSSLFISWNQRSREMSRMLDATRAVARRTRSVGRKPKRDKKRATRSTRSGSSRSTRSGSPTTRSRRARRSSMPPKGSTSCRSGPMAMELIDRSRRLRSSSSVRPNSTSGCRDPG